MGETARDDGTPPPVQPQTGRRPRPPLPAAPSSSNTQSFMPQRSRPQLVRRVNTSQGNRFGGRDQSIASHGGLRDRTNSDGSQGGINRSEQILGAGAHAPVTTDIRLLLASLDKQPVEDEAETTLLDVLERRHVTFANEDDPPPSSSHHHRRISTVFPNIDSPKRQASSRNLIENLNFEGSRRPNLLNRSMSQGRILQEESRQRNFTADADWALNLGNEELVQALSDVSDQNSHAAPLNRGDRHQRVKSALPRFEGLTNPGERARSVALLMKTQAANDMEELRLFSDESNATSWMYILEKQRDTDNGSTGSQRRTEGSHKSGEGANRIKSNRLSGPRTADIQSSFVSRGAWGYRPQRPSSTAPNYVQKHKSNIDHLFEVAEHVEELCKISEGEEAEDVRSSGVFEQENAAFLSQLVASHPEVPPVDDEDTSTKVEDGGINEQTPILRQSIRESSIQIPRPRRIISYLTRPAPGSRIYKFFLWWIELRKQMRNLVVAFDGDFVKQRLWCFLQNELSMIIVPALAISAFLYYKMNNPILPVFPTNASISWWILFLLRHFVTLQMASIAEYLIVDVAAVRSGVSVQLIGPLATLYIINARGWPFTLTIWGILNFLLIQGMRDDENIFWSHWLYFTDIEMFTAENPSGSVVESDIYREILVAFVVVGVATSLKRTVLALYLSKRLYNHYKQRLEKVFEMMLLLTEVANLGNAISNYDPEKSDSPDSDASIHSGLRNSSHKSFTLQDKINRSSTMMIGVLKKDDTMTSYSDSDEEGDEGKIKSNNNTDALHSNRNPSDDCEPMSTLPGDENRNKDDDDGHHHRNSTGEISNLTELLMDNVEPPIPSVLEPVSSLRHEASTTERITSLLDGWEEPVNKADKMAHPTINEILRFRKALTFLDDTHPFGSSFGPAFTRESCIDSAKSLYKRLLKFSPKSNVLHFDVIGVLAYNIDETFDVAKAKRLVKLFRPDKFSEVSLLHFVQSCDGIYKRIRYLRASVGNSTLIDDVLENIFNGIFYFVLTLTIMTLLQMNPWTLLISMSTVIVSFAFALGPSVAKIIEGMIMIAVRRPFDLGDRISIVDYVGAPDNSDDPGYHDTWIVEDCNLFTTTLRLARTNELSTVNNGAIANTRIVNHARSLNALVNVQLLMTLDVTNEQVQIFKSALLQYIRDHPRIWARLINFRIVKVDIPNRLVIYSARVEHVKSWQELLPILQARGDLEFFCTQILLKLDIHYDHYTTTNTVFVKSMPGESNVMVPPSDADSSSDIEEHQD